MNKPGSRSPISQPSLAQRWVVPFQDLRMTDVDAVGGKKRLTGRMISQLAVAGVRVPGGFATTAAAFHAFLDQGGLRQRIHDRLSVLNVDDVRALAACGSEIRDWMVQTPLPAGLEAEIRSHYLALTQATLVCPWRFDLRPPPKICPMRPLPVSRRLF